MNVGNAGTHAINAALYKKLDYDPLTGFAAIGEFASIPLALVAHPTTKAFTGSSGENPCDAP